MEKEENKFRDKSGDRKYFTQTPRLIWALSRTPYDKSFWETVKDIAGEVGECKITTEELATLCMMSTGKVSECRDFWLSNGMLEGQREKDPGKQNSIWHLSIPDIWEENIKFAKSLPRITDRIKYKENQLLELELEKKAKKQAISPNEIAPSPGEIGSISGEKASTPGEISTFIEEEPLEESKEKPAPRISINPVSNSSLFEELIDRWYKCAGKPTPGTLPPGFNGKRFTVIVMDRINSGRTWEDIFTAIDTYWKILKSPNHYYNTEVNIGRFIGKTIDDFWDFDEAWKCFWDRKKGDIPKGVKMKDGDSAPNLAEMTLREFGLCN